MPLFKYSAFISYSSKDKAWATRLRTDLQQLLDDKPVFLDTDRLEEGKPWNSQLTDALQDSEHIIVLYSENAHKSDWVKHEMSEMSFFNALAGEEFGKSRRLLCVLTKTDVSPTVFPQIQSVKGLTAAAESLSASDDGSSHFKVLRSTLPKLDAFLYPLRPVESKENGSGLWLLTAGMRAGERFESYGQQVQNFDWAEFYLRRVRWPIVLRVAKPTIFVALSLRLGSARLIVDRRGAVDDAHVRGARRHGLGTAGQSGPLSKDAPIHSAWLRHGVNRMVAGTVAFVCLRSLVPAPGPTECAVPGKDLMDPDEWRPQGDIQLNAWQSHPLSRTRALTELVGIGSSSRFAGTVGCSAKRLFHFGRQASVDFQ